LFWCAWFRDLFYDRTSDDDTWEMLLPDFLLHAGKRSAVNIRNKNILFMQWPKITFFVFNE
jgi:hypothetical protein